MSEMQVGDIKAKVKEKVEQDNASLLCLVVQIVVETTRGHVDYSGYPTIMHPFGVAEACKHLGARIQALALIHDTLEDHKNESIWVTFVLDDTPITFPLEITFEDLSRVLPADVMEGLDHITRRDNETYEEYIDRCVQCRMTHMPKLEDNIGNDHRADDGLEPEEAERLRKRWRKARTTIRRAIRGS